jgi:hypothetical protein
MKENKKEDETTPGIVRSSFSKRVPMRRKLLVLFVILSLTGVVLLSGCVGQQPTPPATTAPTGSSTQTQAPVTQVSGNQTIKPTVQVTIPATGVFVKVSYLGTFNGTYGMIGALQQVTNSGDRVYEITNATGNVTATFYKQDESTTHDITVGLWKNGVSLTSAKNSTPFGKVSISYKV